MTNDRSRPALACRGLERHFPTAAGPLRVLRGVDLAVEAREVVAVLGPSGSGKSTLLHLLAGLDTPTAGEVWWGDLAVHEQRPQRLARTRGATLGLVFQQHYLLEDLNALDNVTLPGRIVGRLEPERGRELLAAVGLGGRAEALPRVLSGGERQRLAVARALYMQPRVVLADEPTGSLDRENARVVYALLVRLARERGAAVVMVTHDEGLVEDVDRRYRLEAGKLQPLPVPAV